MYKIVKLNEKELEQYNEGKIIQVIDFCKRDVPVNRADYDPFAQNDTKLMWVVTCLVEVHKEVNLK